MIGTSLKKTYLTERETEILQWTACGKTSEEIALLLNLSVPTVNTYVKRACGKLQATNKTHAVTLMIVNGVASALSSSLTTILPFLFGLSRRPTEKQKDPATQLRVLSKNFKALKKVS